MNAEITPVLEIIAKLIGFNTVSAHSNLPLLEFVKEKLAPLGADFTLTFDDSRMKANLYARLGPKDRPAILLSGHSDTVPADPPAAWASDPFSASLRNHCLFGRGVADMKSFLGLMLAIAPEFPDLPLHLAFSYDEELGCIGARRMVEEMRKLSPLPRFAIVGEPTNMQVVSGHKGKKSWRCKLIGQEGHSAYPDKGVNAVEYAALLIAKIREIGIELAKKTAPEFDPPYSTLHVGVIKGGTVLNIIPRECAFEFELRNLPQEEDGTVIAEIKGFAENVLLPSMRKVSPEAGIIFEEISLMAGLNPQGNQNLSQIACDLLGQNTPLRVSYGTEAGLFQGLGIETIVCGPGSIEQAHKPNEFIRLEQITACRDFLGKILARQG